ncbi:MAG TPA: type I methionyl aminopeptidase [Candidatus Saccharimonadales bacterium]|nr:type I methionyl aminopeptidase [Candidatus Saccharimonadales bacterium]
MFTRVKTQSEIEAMRASGQILASVLKKINATAEPGMTGLDASQIAKTELKAHGAIGTFYGVPGRPPFPDVICISINDEVVHGIPDSRQFKDGDVVSFDFGVTYDGMVTDSAFSKVIGKSTKTKQNLLKATERSMYAGIEQLKNGVRVGDIGSAIQKVLDAANLGIVRDLVGHGVGHEMHEDPNIPNYGVSGTGPTLKAGMTIAIEPMATVGNPAVKMLGDGWTISTVDGSLAAHFEHTILITEDGYDILTAW